MSENNNVKSTLETKIESLVIKDAGVEFNGNTLRDLLRPCVYVFLENSTALYVGSSGNGASRPFYIKHKQARSAMDICTRLLIYPCQTKATSKKLERILISELHPIFNKRISPNIVHESCKNYNMIDVIRHTV